MRGARSATRNKVSSMTAPTLARRLRHSSQAAFCRVCQKRLLCCVRTASGKSSTPTGVRGVRGTVALAMYVLLSPPLSQTNARVQPAIGEIDEQIHQHKGGADNQYSRLYHRIVTTHKRLIEDKANPWPGKNRLDHDRTSQEARKLEARHCHRGNEGISERVLVDHP